MKDTFKKRWFYPLLVIALIAIGYKYQHEIMGFVLDFTKSISDTLYWLGPYLVGVGITFLIWWYISLVPMKSGQVRNIVNLSGEFQKAIMGTIPSRFINDPNRSNYDNRYPDWYHIHLRDMLEKNVKVQKWGKPGYEKDPNADLDNTWENPETWFERQTGLYWPGGFYPFRKVQVQTMHLHHLKLKKDSIPSNTIVWSDTDRVIVEETITQDFLPVFWSDTVIIQSADTGGGDAHHDELLQIDIPIEVQVELFNSFSFTTKTRNPHGKLVAQTDSTMRDFVADRDIDDIQKGNHSAPGSHFKEAMKGMNGEWEERNGQSYLAPGLISGFGFGVVANNCYFRQWVPANEESEKMIKAAQRVFISEKEINIQTNEGKAEAGKYMEVMTAKTKMDGDYRKAIVQAGADPNAQVLADAIKGHNGTLILGDSFVGQFVNVDSQFPPVTPSNKKGGKND